MPSPAFTTGRRVDSSSSHAAPDELWRRMMASAPSARKVRPVSLSDSPFLDAGTEARNQRSVGAERFAGQLKARPGASGRLVEEQRDAPLGENAIADDGVLILKLGGPPKQMADFVYGEVEHGEQGPWVDKERENPARAAQ